ncbi:MAG: hypothetical protein ACREV5_07790 [Steroidobacter sp.]
MAGSRSLDGLSVRAVALVAAVLLHAPLLFVGQLRQKPHEQSRAIEVRLDLDQTRVRTPEEIPSSSPARATSNTARVRLPSQDPTPESRTAPPVDWQASGALSAQSTVDSLIRNEGYRDLGPRRAPPFTEPASPPSVFEEPKHRYGEVERDPAGYDRVWHNERCYTELGSPVSARPTARIGNVVVPKCMMSFGKKAPRGDLFEHLKRDKEPPR